MFVIYSFGYFFYSGDIYNMIVFFYEGLMRLFDDYCFIVVFVSVILYVVRKEFVVRSISVKDGFCDCIIDFVNKWLIIVIIKYLFVVFRFNSFLCDFCDFY